MKASSAPGIVLPLLLAVVGVGLILAGQLPLDRPRASLPGIPEPSEVAVATPTPRRVPPGSRRCRPRQPRRSPLIGWPVQLEIPSVELNVAVKHATVGQGGFPPDDAAYVLYQSSEPGRGVNTYIVGHALQHLFKRLWNVQLGAEIKILMSDETRAALRRDRDPPQRQLPRRARRPDAQPAAGAPVRRRPAARAREWAVPTAHERLTLQTSQGFNRNWGELIIVADPLF